MQTYLKFTTFALLLIVIISCNKDENNLKYLLDCIEVKKQENWTKEPFNASYSIMYPNAYISRSKYLLPWSKFEIRREDEKVVIDGGFCHPTATPCEVWDYYGVSIDTELDSIEHYSLDNTFLNIKKTFCQDNITTAIFYYNDSMPGNFRNAYGALYLIDKNDSTFKFAGNIGFAKSEKQEILDILSTLHLE